MRSTPSLRSETRHAGEPPLDERAAATRLAALARDYWEGALESAPTMATALGDRRFDAELEDLTPAGRARDQARLAELLAAAGELDPALLDPADRVTQKALIEVIESDLARLEVDFHAWLIDPLEGPQVSLLNIPSYQPIADRETARAMVARWRRMGPYVDTHIANLKDGLATGRVATADQVRRVTAQLDELLGRPDAEWPLLTPAREALARLPAADAEAFGVDLGVAVRDLVRPALGSYREFLKSEIAPRARPGDRAGVMHVEGGVEAYRKMIQVHTSLDLEPQAIHAIGQGEVERIRGEVERVGRRALGSGDYAAIFRRLRTEREFFFTTRDEIESTARATLARANAAIPRWFGRLPRAACEIVRMEPHEEKHGTLAYYRQPAVDGSRPGRYVINTFEPEAQPRYIAAALAFHEAVPGHHLQVALAQEIEGIPEFRKHLGVTAYVEGWALYAEDLAIEMGLYSTDTDLIGKLSQEAWRACRLVVDTGIHALGWSRQRAIDYMLEHTGESPANVVNEVDRYITWPGQALAYKLGQLEIARLRRAEEARHGARFDIRGFHDAVLAPGAVGLGTLWELVSGEAPS
jgi:uncharacterized protein (DUF885 family)